MAVHSVIVELIAKTKGGGFQQVGAEAAALDRKVGTAQSSIKGKFAAIGSNGRLMGAAVGIGAAVAVVGIAKIAKSGADAFVALGKAVKGFQRITGGTSEDVSQLVFALKRVGVEPDVASKAFFHLSKRIGTGQVDLAKYGLEVKKNADGSVNMKDAVLKLSGSMERLDANGKARRVFELFGRQGAVLLPLLTRSKQELQGFFDLAGKDHQILSDKDRDSALAYAKAMKELDLAMQGFEIQIGRAVVPLLKDITGEFGVLAGFVGDNADAVIFLAKAIGGPLVGALGILGVVKIASIFSRASQAVVGLGSGIASLIPKLVGGSIAMEGFGATSEIAGAQIAGAGRTAAVGWAAIAAPAAIVAGVVGGLFAIADAFGYWDDEVNKSVKTAPKWAKAQLDSFKSAADGPKRYRTELATLLTEQKRLQSGLNTLKDARPKTDSEKRLIAQEVAGTNTLWEASKKLGKQLDTNRARVKALHAVVDPWVKSLKAAGATLTDTGVKLGNIKVPESLLKTFKGKEFDTFAKTVGTAVGLFGEGMTQMVISSGIGAEGLKTLIAQGQQVETAITSSFLAATTVVGKFGDQTNISGDDFVKKLDEMQASAQRFATGVAYATALGAPTSIVTAIARAGPKEQETLDGLLRAIEQGSLEHIKTAVEGTQGILDGLTRTVIARGPGDAVLAAQYGTLVGKALGVAAKTETDYYAQIMVDAFVGRWAGVRIPDLWAGGGSSSPSGGSFRPPAGFRAAGGPVRAGKTYVVGETGPEVFVPKTAGTIVPNNKLGGRLVTGTSSSGDTIIINMSALVADANSGRRVAEALQAHRRNAGRV